MRYIADLQIHSKYSRATSREMSLEHIDEFAQKKGIAVMGTGDFTHPDWFKEIKQYLEPAEPGLFRLKTRESPVRFMLTAEISNIYSKNNKVRKIHNLIFAPDLAVVEEINTQLSWVGNLRSDGRPILGLDSKQLVKIVSEISEDAYVIPAHAWTPWFSIFGSMSGFDSLEECFEELTPKIIAIETGLSSDPAMNWRLSKLDKVALISNSDSHSLAKIGREANVFEGEELSYFTIFEAIKNASPQALKNQANKDLKLKLALTIEFFPEEGKYHYDGHRLCNVVYSPQEAKDHKNLCPRCGRPLTIGVMHRVEDLADRPLDYQPEKFVPFKSLVPLEEIIAEALGRKVGTKGVSQEYDNLIKEFGSEFKILLEVPIQEIQAVSLPIIAEGISRVRAGKLKVKPGFDGQYGQVRIFDEKEREDLISGASQETLF